MVCRVVKCMWFDSCHSVELWLLMSLTKVRPERRGPQRRSCASVSHDMRWRSVSADVPTGVPQFHPSVPPPRYPSTCCLPHLSSALWFFPDQRRVCRTVQLLWGVFTGCWSTAGVRNTPFYFRGLCHRLLEEESVRADTFCGTRRNKSSLWQSAGIWKQASRQFNIPLKCWCYPVSFNDRKCYTSEASSSIWWLSCLQQKISYKTILRGGSSF